MANITLSQITKHFGPVCAVRELSLSIASGSIFGIVGSNGAGKSTTLRMLCGLEKPNSGTARIGDLDCWKQRAAVKLQLGYVPQGFDLYPDLTIREHLVFFATAFRLSPFVREQRIRQLLERTDLAEKQEARAGQLSGGQKRLLALACALVHEPRVLFLDEPTAGLDPTHREALWDWLYELGKQGMTIGVTTHYLEEAERCVEIAVMSHGRLLAKGTPSELKASSRLKPFEIQAEPLLPALHEIKQVPDIFRASLSNGAIRVLSTEPAELYRRLETAWPFAGVRKIGMHWSETTLDDACSALVLQDKNRRETGS